MTGARSARGLAAALLAAALLPASPAQAQHLAYAVTLSSSTITEGQSVTVGLRCTSYCGHNLITLGGSTTQSTIRADIAISPTTYTNVSLSSNVRLTAQSTNSNGPWAGTVTITTTDDGATTGHRTLTVSGTPDTGGTGDNAWSGADTRAITSATLTILDAQAPQVTVSLSPATINESGGTITTVVQATVPTGSEPTTALAVTLSAAPVSPATSADFTTSWSGATTTLTIPANGTTSGLALITAVNNNLDGPETKQVTVRGAVATTVDYRSGSATLTINDDDTSALTVVESGGGTTVTEDLGTDTFEVRLATRPASTVQVAVSSDDADECVAEVDGSTDYDGGTLMFSPTAVENPGPQTTLWSEAQTVTVRGVDDSVLDPGETCTVRLDTSSVPASGDTAYHALADVEVTVTVTDNDVQPTLALTPSAIDESGSNNRATVTATLADPAASQVTLTVSAAPVSPAVAGDYSLSGSTLTIASGATTSTGTVTITAVDNAVDAANKTVTVSATSSGGNTVAPADATLTIRDDDGPGLDLSRTSLSLGEAGEEGSFAVNLGSQPTADVTVTASRPAADATECEVKSGAGAYGASTTLTFTASTPATLWSTPQTVMVRAIDDPAADTDQSCDITLSVSSTDTNYNTLGDETVSVTVVDDDTAGLTLSKTEVSTSEDGTTDMFTVRLATLTGANVTVAIRSSDEGEATVSPASLTFGPAADSSDPANPVFRWNDPQEVTVTGMDDDDPDGPQRYTITLDSSSTFDAAYDGLDDVEVSGTNEDDDAVTVTLSTSAAGGRLAEGESATVTARLGRAVQAATTITVSAAAGTGASAAHFRLSENRTLTVAAGATSSTGAVTITAVDDEVDGPETRQVTVSGSSSGGQGALDPDSVTLTIADNDAAPQASLTLTPAMIDESGPDNAARVTAALSHPSSMATTVTVSAAAGVTVGADNVLSIPAGATASAGAVTLTAVDDEEQGPDREVAVSGRAENAHGIEQPEAVVLTIRDDDGTEAVTAVLLPEAARAMADSRASAVRRRLESADAAEAPEMASLPSLLAEHGPSVQDDSLDWKKTLAGSSFALPLNAAGGGSGGGVAVWGSGDYRDLDGEARGVSWDGDVVSAHLGLDRKLANGLRVGLAASWSEAKFDYRHEGREGEWELEMTSAQPYLGWTTPGGLELWASAGAGSGDLEIAAGGTAREKSDADMWLAAAGARKPLHETESGLRVSLRGEALYSSFEVDGNGRRIQAYTADASRLRLALEARRDRALASGARLSPRFELGLRHDGGDGETGAGVELGGGAEYASGRLTASGGARALAANSDYDEWGADLALAYAPGAGGRGFSFRLAPSWGAVQSGAQKLWEQGAPGLSGAADESDPGGRLEAELGYGLKSPWSRGLLRLTLGGEAVEDAGAACRLKGAVALDATATLGLELEVRDPPSGGAERSLMVTGELRF